MFVKQCSICEEDKPIEEFANHALAGDGLTDNCKACGGVDIVDSLALYLYTPTKQYELGAAAIANDDTGAAQLLIGRLRDVNALYPVALRAIVKLLSTALDRMEGNNG